MTTAIDLNHLGREHVICAYERDGVIVDPGPASCVDTLLAGLSSEPRALLLTHIHLDHAGASGVLAERFPELVVYVHEKGASHIADPTKLLESAARLYGDDMDRLWGPMVPIAERRITALTGGETVEGLEVAYTPGHASHHVAYFDPDSGDAFTGDVGGVRVPGRDYVLPPTPPPDIDLELWRSSLERLEEWEPAALCLTHFGRYEDVGAHLDRLRAALDERGETSRRATADEFAEWSEAQTRSAVDEGSAKALLQAAPPEQLGLGLRRYWDKRAEAAA